MQWNFRIWVFWDLNIARNENKTEIITYLYKKHISSKDNKKNTQNDQYCGRYLFIIYFI